jgi:hypothetical protein
MGFIEETGVAQYQRDARIITIYEGTTGIQALDLMGRKLIRNRGKDFKLVLSEIRSDIKKNSSWGEFGKQKKAVLNGFSQIESVAKWVSRRVLFDVNVIGSASFNYLMLNGTVFGAAYLLKSAVIAKETMADDPDFVENKILTAKFYVEQILPRAEAYARAAKASLDTLNSVNVETL